MEGEVADSTCEDFGWFLNEECPPIGMILRAYREFGMRWTNSRIECLLA